MKITFFTYGSYPYGMAMANRLHLYCKALQHKGNDVLVMAPEHLNTSNKVDEGEYDGVKYKYFKTGKTIHPFIDSCWLLYVYAYQAYVAAKNADVIYVTGGGYLWLTLVAKAVHMQGKKIVCEMNENPYSTELNRFETHLQRSVSRFIYNYLATPRIDGYISISDNLTAYINKYAPKSTVIQVPVLTDIEKVNPSSVSKISGLYILHAGALSELKDGVKAMIKAFIFACGELDLPLKFVFTNKVGNKKLLNWISTQITRNNLQDRIIFTGKVTSDELASLRNNALLSIVNKPVNNQNTFNFPTKLAELLANSVPVIASDFGEMAKYLTKYNAAYMVEPNNIQQISEGIIWIVNNPELVNKMNERALELVKNEFYYLNYSDKLHTFFKQLIK